MKTKISKSIFISYFSQFVLVTFASLAGIYAVADTFNPDKIKIINHVDKCIGISPSRIEKTAHGMLMTTNTNFKKVTAYCGCKSRLLYYHVNEIPNIKGGGIKLERMRGLKNTHTAKDMALEFIISTDKDISYTGKIEIEIGCSPPD